MRVFILSVVLVLPFIAYSQKARDYTAVVQEIVLKIEKSAATDKPLRIAVVPFTPSYNNSLNRFGDYITESVTGKLVEQPHKFKVFERARLDAILKENELMLSGLMKPAEAIRIGQLLPIDALLSGTYTALKSYIDISGRLIDVASGEILLSFSGRIKQSKNLRVLFNDAQPGTVTPTPSFTTTIILPGEGEKATSDEEKCQRLEQKITPLLNDLSTPERIDQVVHEAIKTPFDTGCGKWHYTIINRFKRYAIRHAVYHEFLLNTLTSILYPSLDDRAYSIISYLASDDVIDQQEWDILLNTLARTEFQHYRYISAVFDVKTAEGTAQKRIDQYINLLNANKIGIPRPLSYNQGFFQLMQGLSRNHRLQLYVYEKYSSNVVTEPKHSVSNHMLYLNRMYDRESDPAIKTKIIRWTATYFNQHRNEKSPEQLYQYAYKFDPEIPEEWNRQRIEEQNKEKATQFPIHDLHLLIDLCRDLFAAYAIETPYESTREKRLRFCIKYNIDVPGAIPTLTEAHQVLKGPDLDEQLKVMKLLIQMGEKTKSLEPVFIELLDKRSLENKAKLQEVQRYAIRLLGQHKTTNLKAIAHMIDNLASYNKEDEASQEALVSIGKPVVQPLTQRLSTTTEQDGGLRYSIIVMLGKLGRDAKPAEPLLTKLLTTNKNADIKYALEAALQSINR